jgi:hypothetical protein
MEIGALAIAGEAANAPIIASARRLLNERGTGTTMSMHDVTHGWAAPLRKIAGWLQSARILVQDKLERLDRSSP